jgi:hypothetical protein
MLNQSRHSTDFVKREIRETLRIKMGVFDRLIPSVYCYPTYSIELITYTVIQASGELKLKEHHRCLMLSKDELNSWD